MKKISVKENGVVYNVDAENTLTTVIYPIDGMAISEGQKCDKFITIFNNESGMAIFLELKGADISHAIDQLEATIRHPLFLPYPSKGEKTRARIVSNRGVSSASRTEMERAKIRFLKNYNVELRQLSSLQSDIKVSI